MCRPSDRKQQRRHPLWDVRQAWQLQRQIWPEWGTLYAGLLPVLRLPNEVCGTVIVANDKTELPRLEALYERSLENTIPVKCIPAAEVQEVDPHGLWLAGIRVYFAGITHNDGQVAQRYVELNVELGQMQDGDRCLNMRGRQSRDLPNGKAIETPQGTFQGQTLISCAEAYSDRMARLTGTAPRTPLIPFQGEYYELVPEKRHLVNILSYPVPNPPVPFLGVHFTKMINGSVHAESNAVFSFKRAGDRKTDMERGDVLDVKPCPAFWKLVIHYADEGLQKIVRIAQHMCRAFVQSLQRLIPAVQPEAVIPMRVSVPNP